MQNVDFNKNKKKRRFVLNGYWKKTIYILIFLHIFFIVNLFKGKNTPQAYFMYKKEFKEKQETLNRLIQERSQIVKTMELLNDKNLDIDLLEELLRGTLQVSLPDEKMVLIKSNNEQVNNI
jgi:cell division protein FtsB